MVFSSIYFCLGPVQIALGLLFFYGPYILTDFHLLDFVFIFLVCLCLHCLTKYRLGSWGLALGHILCRFRIKKKSTHFKLLVWQKWKIIINKYKFIFILDNVADAASSFAFIYHIVHTVVVVLVVVVVVMLCCQHAFMRGANIFQFISNVSRK